jgi:hypothetical protein
MHATRKRLSRKRRSVGFRAPHDRPDAIDLARKRIEVARRVEAPAVDILLFLL